MTFYNLGDIQTMLSLPTPSFLLTPAPGVTPMTIATPFMTSPIAMTPRHQMKELILWYIIEETMLV